MLSTFRVFDVYGFLLCTDLIFVIMDMLSFLTASGMAHGPMYGGRSFQLSAILMLIRFF